MATGYICNGSMTVEERKEKIKQAIDLYRSGERVPDIAVMVGCDRSTVYKWLRLCRIPARVRKYPLDLIDRIADMYQSMTRVQIAQALDMDYYSVQYIINAYNIRKGDYLECDI